MWWAYFPRPDKIRPVVLISRQAAVRARAFVTVARVTTRVRAIPTEVDVGPSEGLSRASVANCDDVATIPKGALVKRAGALGTSKVAELDRALKFALGLD